ncbi:MAG: GNAT family N-acetyltransferase [Caldilineaceae bacterium]
MLHIDPFAATDVEYAAVVAVNHALYADDDSNVEEMRHYDSSRNPDYLYQRYVLRWDEEIAGYGMLYVPYWAYVPGRYSLYIAVHPTYQRRGIGSAFYDFALEQLAQQEEAVSVVHAHTRSETPQGIRFLEARGFVQVMRWWDCAAGLGHICAGGVRAAAGQAGRRRRGDHHRGRVRHAQSRLAAQHL